MLDTVTNNKDSNLDAANPICIEVYPIKEIMKKAGKNQNTGKAHLSWP